MTRTINQIANKMAKTGFQSSPNQDGNQANINLVKQIVDKLFDELKDIKPAWRVTMPTPKDEGKAKIQYVKAMIEGGVTDHAMIEKGMRAARAERGKYAEFFPGCGKFVDWCTKADSSEQARIKNKQEYLVSTDNRLRHGTQQERNEKAAPHISNIKNQLKKDKLTTEETNQAILILEKAKENDQRIK